MVRQSLWILPVALAAIAATLGAQAPSNEAGRRLHALFDREWEWELAESPLTASSLGDKRWNDRWDDLTVAALERRQKHREEVLTEIEAFPRASLSPDDQINYDVFRYQYRMTVEGFKYRSQLIRTDTYGGVQNSEQVETAQLQMDRSGRCWARRSERVQRGFEGSDRRVLGARPEQGNTVIEVHQRIQLRIG